MKQYLDKINSGREVRESLASLCGLLRTSGESILRPEDAEALLICGEKCLKSEDPKIRKNAAKLLGLTGKTDAEATASLVEAYASEQTRFVRSAYLDALVGRDIAKYRAFLENRLALLQDTEVNEENRKHINEESAALRKLLGSIIPAGGHVFDGYDADNTVLFVVNTCYREAFAESLGAMRRRIVHGGVLVRTTNLSDILTNRVWREAVFRVPGALTVPADPYEAAAIIAGGMVGDYLAKRLKGEGELRYRLDVRCRDEETKKRFIKRLAPETDRLSEGRLRNDPGAYEVTFRFSETEGGQFRLGIVFAVLRDSRFDYRRETVAGSLHPTDAAAVLQAAAPYLSQGAQVLDPFCGVGTMIEERRKIGPIRQAFGVDQYGPAIEKARANVKADNVWFVHRDFFDYRQDHRFDEIITNMPFRENGDGEDIGLLYRRFFRRVPEHLRESGTLVMVSHDPKTAEASVPANMTVVRRIPMRESGEIAAFVIRFRGLA